MENSCDRFEIQDVDKFTLIVSKDPTILSVIVTAKDMMRKCLSCPQLKTGCSDAENFVRLLDDNLSNEKGFKNK